METKLLPKSTFAEKYVIDSLLGSGGMGQVYKATQIDLGRSVALKVLQPALVADDEMQERFQREAKALATLAHKNIGMFYQYGVSQATPFIAMEFVEGQSLHSVLQTEGKLEWKRAVNIAIQICDALSYAHKAGVIHRDIKPSNIMLIDEARTKFRADPGLSNASMTESDSVSELVKILDFGLAKILAPGASEIQKLTQTGELVGSVPYLSPEICSGKANDPRADVYSLACVLYEMITGVLPHNADNPISLMHKHMTERPTPVAEKLQDPSLKAIDTVLSNALAKDPEERYQKMDEFRSDLLLVRDDNAASVKEKTRSERPSIVHIVGTVAAVLIACVEVFMFVQNSATGQAMYAKLRGIDSYDKASVSRNLSTLDRIEEIGGYKESNKFMKELYDSSSKLPAFDRSKLCLEFAKRSLKAGDESGSTNWSARGFHQMSVSSDSIPLKDFLDLCKQFAELHSSQSARYNRYLDAPIDRMTTHFDKTYRAPQTIQWWEFEARQSMGRMDERHGMRLLSLAVAQENAGNFAAALQAYEDSERELLKKDISRSLRCEILLDQARMHRALKQKVEQRELTEYANKLMLSGSTNYQAHIYKKLVVELIALNELAKARQIGDSFARKLTQSAPSYAPDILDLLKEYQSSGHFAEGLSWLKPHLKALHRKNSVEFRNLMNGISLLCKNPYEQNLFNALRLHTGTIASQT